MDNDASMVTTRGRILAAAEKCPTARGVLKELFPEVFSGNPPMFGQFFRWPHSGENVYLRVSDGQGLSALGSAGHTDGSWYFVAIESGTIYRASSNNNGTIQIVQMERKD